VGIACQGALRQPCKNTTFPTRQPREITPSLADLSAYEIRVRVGLQSGNALFSPIFQKLIRCTGFFTKTKIDHLLSFWDGVVGIVNIDLFTHFD
jgi:hypothetical protein